MRKREPHDKKDFALDDKENNENLEGRMRTKIYWIKILFALSILLGLGVYLYLYLWTSKLPFEMSPEMEALYRKHGEGEAKKRRRPHIDEESLDHVRSVANEELKTETQVGHEKPKKQQADGDPRDSSTNAIHVAIVACGNRAPEAITSLKSFAMFAKQDLHFHIFAESELHGKFKTEVQKWPKFIAGNLKLDVHPIQFPGSDDFQQWKTLFKPCASQRLFLPLLLMNIDAVIYVDTDVLLLRPADDLWALFKNFNATQLAGLAPEGQVDATGWYNRFAMHPYYGRLGVNSGVMLMNLTRMRNTKWNDDVYPIYKKFQFKITWGDQDILNIMFHFKPETLYVFPCEWNYRPDHCMYGNNCETALQGISVVHGNRQVFQNNKQPEFKVVYEAFRDYKFGEDTKIQLKEKIKENLEKYKSTYCGENRDLFTKIL